MGFRASAVQHYRSSRRVYCAYALAAGVPGDDRGVQLPTARRCSRPREPRHRRRDTARQWNLLRVVRARLLCRAPTELVALTEDTNIDTDVSPICDQQNDQKEHYCVIAGAGFTSTKRIFAQGSKPLILLSTMTMVLTDSVDVSSNHNGSRPRGAGSNPLQCTGTTPATGASGGFGGSFGGQGGPGQDREGTRGLPLPR